MIKAVIFDLDDTLLWDKKCVQEAFEETCEHARSKYDLQPGPLEEAVREAARKLYASYETYPFTKRIGINPFEGLWGDFTDKNMKEFQRMKDIVPAYRKEAWTQGLAALGIDDPQLGHELGEMFPAARRKKAFVYEDTFPVLEELKTDYQLMLLTNGSPVLQNEKLNMTPELVPYFERILISGAFGFGKPDPSIFDHALALLSCTKDEAMMVGDNLHTDILGSNRIGMKNVWLNREHMKGVEDIKPTYEVSSLKELPALLKKASS